MKLIYVCATFPWPKGNEEFFIPEIKELLRQGHQVLLVPRSPSGNIINLEATKLKDISVKEPLLSLDILIGAFMTAGRYPKKTFKAIGTMMVGSDPLTFLKNMAVFCKALWLSRLAREWGADHIHAHWAATTATIAMIASELSQIPWSFTAHRGDVVQRNILPTKVGNASFVRVISRASEELTRHIVGEGNAGKFRRIHMGISLPEGAIERVPRNCYQEIACPANLIPVKGHRYLLEAISLLKRRGTTCRLHVIGAGELLGGLKRQCRTLDIESQVVFHRYIPQHELFEMYAKGKIGMVVLPSLDLGNGLHEGIPVALMEAMSHGIPVVSTSTGGIGELICNGAGILVPDKDPSSLADAIEQLLLDDTYRLSIAEGGKKRIAEEFEIKKVVADIVYEMEKVRSSRGAA